MYSPDEVALARIRRNVAGGYPLELGQALELMRSARHPPRVNYTQFAVTVLQSETPALLIPANPNRMNFVLTAIQVG
jgi:hypothetical protein